MEDKKMEVRRMSNANMVTLIGFLFSVIMMIFFILGEITEQYILFWILAPISFFISMLCDVIDGKVARKEKTEGPIGATLDEIRDKMSMLMLFSPLVAYGIIHWLFLTIITLREFFVLMLRLIYLIMKKADEKPDVSAKNWGKIKTVSQTLAGIFFMLALLNYNDEIHIQWIYELITPYKNNGDWQLIHLILQIIIATFSVFTGIMYGIMYRDYLHRAVMDIKEKEKILKNQTGPQPTVKEE